MQDGTFISRTIGIDVACGGKGADYTALATIDEYRVYETTGGEFDRVTVMKPHFVLQDMVRENSLTLDKQLVWALKYIADNKKGPMRVVADATRELGFFIQLQNALPPGTAFKCIWTGGMVVGREGREYHASKAKTLMDLKSLMSIGALTVAPKVRHLNDLIKEMQGFTFEDNGNGFLITSSAKHDDLAMALACACLYPIEKKMFERASTPRVLPRLFR